MTYLILGAVLVMLVILVAPISLGYDSGEQWFRVKWLGLSITRKLPAQKPEKVRKTMPRKRKVPGSAIRRPLWQQRELVRELIHQVWRFVLEAFRTLSFRDSEASLSLPDPMWNGLLYAVVSNIHLENVDLSVNFENRNYARIWVTVYPYRLARKLAALLLHLPYMRIWRFAREVKKVHPK